MKMKYLIVFVVSMSIRAWALGDVISKWPIMVSSGINNTCVIDIEGLKCRGDILPGSFPALKNPIQVSVGGRHICALDSEGVKCWGNNNFGQLNVPELKSPTQVSSGDYHTCALDAEGVKCWGDNDNGEINVPVLKSPIQVSAGETHTCALDADGVKCWGDYSQGQLNVPKLKSPIQVSAGSGYACALDAEGVKCWGDRHRRFDKSRTNVPRLKSPIQVSAGTDSACALDSEGVKCWGDTSDDQLKVPDLKSPIQVSSGISYTCVLDLESVKCWQQDPSLRSDLSDLNLSFMNVAISTMTSARAQYLKSIADINYEKKFETEYLVYRLISPAVFSFESSYFVETLAPKFNQFIYVLKSSLGYSGDIIEIRDAEIHRKLAIVSIKSALSGSADFLPPASQVVLQNGIRAAGTAFAEPMNSQKIKELLTQIDALSAEKQQLKSSTKSAFLAESLELAANWLREKVK